MQEPLPGVWAAVTVSGPRTSGLPLTLSKRDSHPRKSLVLLVNHSLCWKVLGETSGSFYTDMSPQVPPALEYHLSHTFLLPRPWLDTGPCAHLPPDKPTFSTMYTSHINMRWVSLLICGPLHRAAQVRLEALGSPSVLYKDPQQFKTHQDFTEQS